MGARATERPDLHDPARERIVEILDEREPLARTALGLIAEVFPPNQRQPLEQIAMEIAEKRLGLLTSTTSTSSPRSPRPASRWAWLPGVYLGGVNAGFVTYLAVRPEARSRRLGRRLRVRLVEAFRSDARQMEWDDLAWVVGEVRRESPWLARLVRDRAVVPFDLTYYHPGIEPGESDEDWVLYRQPVGDVREKLPVGEVRQLIYAIWRRAYRVRWPLQQPGFQAMLAELEGRSMVGAHPGVAHSHGR
jgi:ribosomal protein S18 acetylase RimI-like enzyme